MKEEDKILSVDKKQDVKYCIPLWLRDEQMAVNISRIKERVEPHVVVDERIAIVCFGPSLNETWEQIKDYNTIISCSGSHKFLLDRGIVPTYHIEVDPREHKVKLIGQPNINVKYLIASCCHPKVLDHLDGFDVRLWHVFANGENGKTFPEIFPRGEWAITGGSSVGLRAMTIARFLGYKNQDVFGMDGSFPNKGNRHAAEHPNRPPVDFTTEYKGVTYYTTPSFLECARQTFHELDMLKDVDAKFFGNGLVQDMAKDYVKKDLPNSQANLIAFNYPEVISVEYIQLNKQLHKENLAYGIGGGKHKDTVLKLSKIIESTSILDYGCQPLDAKLLTPDGWTTMGAIQIGDFIIGKNGNPVKVLSKHSPGLVDIFKVYFSDHSQLIVDGNHLWSIRNPNNQKRNEPFIVKRTCDLIDNLKWSTGESWQWRIPMVSPINFHKQSLIIDPYLFGVIIGDGNISQGCIKIFADNKKVVREVELVLDQHILSKDMHRRGSDMYRIINKDRSNTNILKNEFVDQGLWGKCAWNKFIPNKYLFNSIENRISLLQGLIDTDGEIGKSFHLSYSTTSYQLSKDIQFLVESLGGTAKIIKRAISNYKYKNKIRIGRQSFVIHIKVPKQIIPTRAKNWKAPTTYLPNRLITSIEKIGVDVVMGISVDSVDQLYITENCIVTHNCGKGYLAKELPFPIWEYDPAIEGKDATPKPADIVICTDVLEHIEPDKLNFVLDDLRRCVKRIGYFTIHTGPSVKTLADGRNAHLIQRGEQFWKKKLKKFFTLEDKSIVNKPPILHCMVAPKKNQNK